MKNQFVTYEIAKALKELGFNEICLTTYKQSINPTKHGMWEIQSIIGGISFYGKEQSDCHKRDFTGYRNSTPEKFQIQFVAAPLWQQAIDWLREKKHIRITEELGKGTLGMHCFSVRSERPTELTEGKTYSAAREAAILKAIELINHPAKPACR